MQSKKSKISKNNETIEDIEYSDQSTDKKKKKKTIKKQNNSNNAKKQNNDKQVPEKMQEQKDSTEKEDQIDINDYALDSYDDHSKSKSNKMVNENNDKKQNVENKAQKMEIEQPQDITKSTFNQNFNEKLVNKQNKKADKSKEELQINEKEGNKDDKKINNKKKKNNKNGKNNDFENDNNQQLQEQLQQKQNGNLDKLSSIMNDEINENKKYSFPYFLQTEFIKDSEGRGINDPEYDSSTVFIPSEFLKDETPIFKQYWNVKKENYDKIVFFKVNRNFICLYRDAEVMHQQFDLDIGSWGGRPYVNIMDSQQPLYIQHLINKGLKCAIVDKIGIDRADESLIQRELTHVISSGTYIDYEGEDYSSRYLMAIVISAVDKSFGIAAVDCTTHEFYLDDFQDDEQHTNFKMLMAKLKPVETVTIKNNITKSVDNIIKQVRPKPTYTVSNKFQFMNIKQIFSQLKNEFTSSQLQVKLESEQQSISSHGGSDIEEEEQNNKKLNKSIDQIFQNEEINNGQLPEMYPQLFKDLEELYDSQETEMKQKYQQSLQAQSDQNMESHADDDSNQQDIYYRYYMMLQSLMLLLTYLRKLGMSETVFKLGQFNLIDSSINKELCLQMDSHVIDNLDIFEVKSQTLTTETGSLLDYISYTKTKFGKRLLKKWLSAPLNNEIKVKNRLDAVENLINQKEIMQTFQEKISKLSDLERGIGKVFNGLQKNRIKASSFEKFPQQKLIDFTKLMKELSSLESIIQVFKEIVPQFTSTRLKRLCTFKDCEPHKILAQIELANKDTDYLKKKQAQSINQGLFPRLNDIITKYMEQVQEDKDGIPYPSQGINKKYDDCVDIMDKIKKKLMNELEKWKQKLKNPNIKFVNGKLRFEMQISDDEIDIANKSSELYLTSKVQGYYRFQTKEIEDLLHRLHQKEEDLAMILVPFIKDYIKQFQMHKNVWLQAVSCIAELDCLCSLATCSLNMKISCKPEVITYTQGGECIFELQDMIHPCMEKAGYEMIPNDTVFDAGVNILLISGPNMGGKSTLIRQNCLAIILAQIGCLVPAKHFKLTLFDKIFCRIGAKDRIQEKKSTFFVELEETVNILNQSSINTFAIFDELGRGTSTYDGISIAYGVLKYFCEKIKCKVLFTTHYNLLLDEYKLYNCVNNYMMEYKFDEGSNKIISTFKFIKGQSEKSFSLRIAQMVGIPQPVIKLAEDKENEINKETNSLGKHQKITQNFNSIMQALLSKNVKSKDLVGDLEKITIK